MSSALFYNICGLGYAAALFLFIFNLAWKKASVRKAATVAASLSFLLHTLGMLFRWFEAGEVEVAAVERAQDVTLTGKAWFVVFMQHPPWSNLYEIMVMMAWGVVLVFLVSEVKWRIRLAGVFALLLALTALGLASLNPTDSEIKPLVPALQSWWIMIHVISSAVGYASGTMAAVMSLLYLIKAKERITLNAVAAGTYLLSSLLFLILGRGVQLFTTGQYRVKLMGELNGSIETVGRMVDGSFHPYYVGSPGVGILLIATIIACVVSGVVLMKRRDLGNGVPTGDFINKLAFFAPLALSVATIGLIVLNSLIVRDYQLPQEVASQLTHGAPPPWRLHFTSAQWDLALFAIVVGGQLFIAAAVMMPERLRALLPEAKKLDRGAYYTVLIAFALVAVVLVTGALWAHYAWGRYWGWDPKEVGALVIWINYALYLHSRVTYGWIGVPSAVIAVLGFFIIIAGFLGVNLGWFADGLHSYGSA